MPKKKSILDFGGIVKGRKVGKGNEREYTKKVVSEKIVRSEVEISEKNIEDIRRIVRYFRGRAEVSALYVFGSLANGYVTDESDIDIAVLVDEKKLEKINYGRLKKQYYDASPYFSLRAIDIVVLNTAPVYLKYRILKTGKILFDRNRKLSAAFTERALTDYLDFKPIEDTFIRDMGERLRRGSFGR